MEICQNQHTFVKPWTEIFQWNNIPSENSQPAGGVAIHFPCFSNNASLHCTLALAELSVLSSSQMTDFFPLPYHSYRLFELDWLPYNLFRFFCYSVLTTIPLLAAVEWGVYRITCLCLSLLIYSCLPAAKSFVLMTRSDLWLLGEEEIGGGLAVSSST